MAKITTKEEAFVLADKIAKYARGNDFKSFSFEADFERKRSNPQNKYYWGVVIEAQFKYFSGNLVKLLGWLFKALSVRITRELIHEINKIVYNNGKSTAKLKIGEYMENFIIPLREDMLHECQFDIPPPEDRQLEEAYKHYLKTRGKDDK